MSDPTPAPAAMTDELVYDLIGAVVDTNTKRTRECAEALLAELARLRGEVTRLAVENATLLANAGVGGYSADAPEEIHLIGLASHGCDAWMHAQRAFVWEGKLDDEQSRGVADGTYTQPVKYVRADVAKGRRAPAPIDQAREPDATPHAAGEELAGDEYEWTPSMAAARRAAREFSEDAPRETPPAKEKK